MIIVKQQLICVTCALYSIERLSHQSVLPDHIGTHLQINPETNQKTRRPGHRIPLPHTHSHQTSRLWAQKVKTVVIREKYKHKALRH